VAVIRYEAAVKSPDPEQVSVKIVAFDESVTVVAVAHGGVKPLAAT
jgi:hypothetical protein